MSTKLTTCERGVTRSTRVNMTWLHVSGQVRVARALWCLRAATPPLLLLSFRVDPLCRTDAGNKAAAAAAALARPTLQVHIITRCFFFPLKCCVPRSDCYSKKPRDFGPLALGLLIWNMFSSSCSSFRPAFCRTDSLSTLCLLFWRRRQQTRISAFVFSVWAYRDAVL